MLQQNINMPICFVFQTTIYLVPPIQLTYFLPTVLTSFLILIPWVPGSYSLVVFQFNIFAQSLIWNIRAASHIGQKGHFFDKKSTINFTTPNSIPFISVLHQNKALCNFHKKGAVSDFQTDKRSILGSLAIFHLAACTQINIHNALIHTQVPIYQCFGKTLCLVETSFMLSSNYKKSYENKNLNSLLIDEMV